MRKVLAVIDKEITESQKCMLRSPIIKDEVKKAMESLKSRKATGMDSIIHEL